MPPLNYNDDQKFHTSGVKIRGYTDTFFLKSRFLTAKMLLNLKLSFGEM